MIYGYTSIPSFASKVWKVVRKVVRPLLFRSSFSLFPFFSLRARIFVPWTGPTFDVSTRCPRTESERRTVRDSVHLARFMPVLGGGVGEKRKKKKRKKKKEGEKGKMQNKSEREEKNRRHERGREKSSKAESWVGDGGCESECRAGAFKKTEHTGSVER